ncbi:hypothetical protein [Pantoea sp.]|uniref:RipA family octameric membrane protein n=1 Tax=Pantoea sp. TaxID=69393 RepID=UPI00289FF079|nr:hypothetical protein [Pantoea sp.]
MFNKHTYNLNSRQETNKNDPVEDEALQAIYSTNNSIKIYVNRLLGKNRFAHEQLTWSDLDRLKEAYNRSHEIRRADSDLYWKRAAWLWTLNAVLFAAWGILVSSLSSAGVEDVLADFYSISVISFLGLLFTIISSFIMAAGKYRQKVWEYHIDNLESFFSGRLYSLHFASEHQQFSISQLIEITYLICALLWAVSLAQFSASAFILLFPQSYNLITLLTFASTFIILIAFYWLRWRTSLQSRQRDITGIIIPAE